MAFTFRPSQEDIKHLEFIKEEYGIATNSSAISRALKIVSSSYPQLNQTCNDQTLKIQQLERMIGDLRYAYEMHEASEFKIKEILSKTPDDDDH